MLEKLISDVYVIRPIPIYFTWQQYCDKKYICTHFTLRATILIKNIFVNGSSIKNQFWLCITTYVRISNIRTLPDKKYYGIKYKALSEWSRELWDLSRSNSGFILQLELKQPKHPMIPEARDKLVKSCHWRIILDLCIIFSFIRLKKLCWESYVYVIRPRTMDLTKNTVIYNISNYLNEEQPSRSTEQRIVVSF